MGMSKFLHAVLLPRAANSFRDVSISQK